MTDKSKTDDVLLLVLFFIMVWCGVWWGLLVLPDSRSLLHPVTLAHARSFTHAIDIHGSAVYHLHFFAWPWRIGESTRKFIGFIKIMYLISHTRVAEATQTRLGGVITRDYLYFMQLSLR